MKYAPVLLATTLAVTAAHAQPAPVRTDQHAIARQLLGQDSGVRTSAFYDAQAIGRENSGQELRAALIAFLERENRIVVEARRRGVAVATLENPEFIAHVAAYVAELQDPASIPALARALDSGSSGPLHTLVAFGEQAAPAILAVVTSPQSSHEAVEGGLVALRFMVEEAAPRPLTVGTLNQIRRAVQLRLTGPQTFVTVWDAVDLAVLLKDDDLRRIVQSLASNRSEVIARGITAPDLIERTQKLATDRLAGVPALPRP
jgi:hypothetical protein